MKKGQLESHTVMYTLFAIIAVLILIFGFKAIATISEKSRDADILNLKSSLKRDIANLRYGDVKERTYELPRGVNGICFVDRGKIIDPNNYPFCSGECTPASELLKNVVKDTDYNVFLLTNDVPEGFFIEKVSMDCCGFYCLKKTGNSVGIKLEGKGDSISIS